MELATFPLGQKLQPGFLSVWLPPVGVGGLGLARELAAGGQPVRAVTRTGKHRGAI